MAILESSFLIDFLRDRAEAVALMRQLQEREQMLVIVSPSVMELWRGAIESQFPDEEKEKIRELLYLLPTLPFTTASAIRAAEVRQALKHQPIQEIDCMIAGIALENNEVVVTRDEHFARIPGLKVLKY